MATSRTMLVALAIAWVAALAGFVWMMTAAGIGLHHLPSILIYLGPVMQTCVLLSIISAAIGVVSLFVGAQPRLWLGIGGAAGLGVLGGLYGAVGARSMLINMNPPIPFSIYAPAYAEAFLVLLLGLTGAMLCLGIFVVRRPAIARPPPTD